jgi:fructose-1,6-bisphosphatase/inositol monophosphatase family enzyme
LLPHAVDSDDNAKKSQPYTIVELKMSKKCLETMIRASQLAGLKIREQFSTAAVFSSTEYKTKTNSADLVTETDIACQELIVKTLLKNHPDHVIIGEESAEGVKFKLTEQKTFIIDPIDGTSNFARGIPHCAVLISRSCNKVIDLAVILDPFRGELFHAIRGEGAFLENLSLPTLERTTFTGTKLSVSKVNTMKEATILTDLGYTRDRVGVSRFHRLCDDLLVERNVRSLRVLGSCGLGLAWVACGRADAYVEMDGPLIWDFSGGSLIVEEAGGVARDPFTGNDLDLLKRSILVANVKPIADEIVKCCSSFASLKGQL